jgi:hypothetical protein
MERPIRILLAALGTFLFTAVAGWLAINILGRWLGPMTADDPIRQVWRPRIQFAQSHCIELMAITWFLVFGLCWIFTNGLRAKRLTNESAGA